MKYDLDMLAYYKLSLLGIATMDMQRAERDFAEFGESAAAPSHVADYEHWKMTNKRNKR